MGHDTAVVQLILGVHLNGKFTFVFNCPLFLYYRARFRYNMDERVTVFFSLGRMWNVLICA